MNIAEWKKTLPAIGIIAGMMAMALSCGGGATEQAAAPEAAMQMSANSETADRVRSESGSSSPRQPAAARPAQPQAPAAAAAPVPASGAATESADAKQGGSEEPASPQDQPSGRRLIVEAWVSLEVNEIDPMVRSVELLAGQRGGWVESAEIFGEAGYRSASLRVRVPADQLENTLDALRGLGRVTDEGISATDVTERLIDNEARLTAWHAQEERLVTLLENAPTVEDIIQIERRISEVRSDIEHVEATQRNLTNRVATSLVTVNLRLPARFAADPPHGTLTLNVGNPTGIADAIASVVDLMGGYVGRQHVYDEGRGRVVDMVVFVKPADLSGLMDHAGTLGQASGRNMTSVGPAPASDVPNARLTLSIRSDVDLGGSIALAASEPLEVGEQIREHAESLGGFVETWHESQGDDYQNVRMELVVKSADLRSVMDFGASLGETEHWEYNAAGQNPVDDAPNARLDVSVYTEQTDLEEGWIVVGVIVAVVVVAAIIVAVVLMRRRRGSALSRAGLEISGEE